MCGRILIGLKEEIFGIIETNKKGNIFFKQTIVNKNDKEWDLMIEAA